jgi:hypothetical protein
VPAPDHQTPRHYVQQIHLDSFSKHYSKLSAHMLSSSTKRTRHPCGKMGKLRLPYQTYKARESRRLASSPAALHRETKRYSVEGAISAAMSLTLYRSHGRAAWHCPPCGSAAELESERMTRTDKARQLGSRGSLRSINTTIRMPERPEDRTKQLKADFTPLTVPPSLIPKPTTIFQSPLQLQLHEDSRTVVSLHMTLVQQRWWQEHASAGVVDWFGSAAVLSEQFHAPKHKVVCNRRPWTAVGAQLQNGQSDMCSQENTWRAQH